MIDKISRTIVGRMRLLLAAIEKERVKRRPLLINETRFSRDRWKDSIICPRDFYFDCFQFFHSGLEKRLRDHRFYFTTNGRGFGEDAFHVLWWMLLQELRPKTFLEIGVYRGQVLSLVSLLQGILQINGTVTGISPFLPAGDSVSRYRSDVDYREDTIKNFQYFKLPDPDLIKAFSTDKSASDKIRSGKWDMIYIDGNHDYEVAKQDWEICAQNLNRGGIIVLDDSALSTEYRPPAFATGGHPGPSQLAQEVDSSRFKEILRVGHNRVFQRIQ
jgi:predicted O-methyltransferase YrrM